MRTVILSVSALFASLALLVIGNALLGTLVSLRLNLLGVNETAIGLILACYSVGFVGGTIYGTDIIRSVGHVRAFAVYAAIACVVALLYPMTSNLLIWSLLRLLTGACLAGLMTVTESWINDRATNDNRGKILGVYTINFYLASSIGQFLVGWNNPEYFIAFSIVAILVVLSLIPLSLTQGLIPASPSAQQALKSSDFFRQAPSGITGALVSGFAISAFVSLAPVFAIGSGMSVTNLSAYMAFSICCAIALQWPAGWLSDRIGRLPVLLWLLILAAIAALFSATLGAMWRGLVFLFSGLFFAFCASIYPVSVALANDNLPSNQLVPACSALLRIYGVGSIAGPVLAGLMMQIFGGPALFIVIAMVFFSAAVSIQLFFRAGDKVAIDEQVDFVTISPVSTPVLSEIDPRNEDFEQHHPGEPAEWDIADKMEMLVPVPETPLEEQRGDSG